jgi:hypothetical protein
MVGGCEWNRSAANSKYFVLHECAIDEADRLLLEREGLQFKRARVSSAEQKVIVQSKDVLAGDSARGGAVLWLRRSGIGSDIWISQEAAACLARLGVLAVIWSRSGPLEGEVPLLAATISVRVNCRENAGALLFECLENGGFALQYSHRFPDRLCRFVVESNEDIERALDVIKRSKDVVYECDLVCTIFNNRSTESSVACLWPPRNITQMPLGWRISIWQVSSGA